MVSYANRGGGKAALQLRQVLQGLHMNVTETNVDIKLSEVDFSKTAVDEVYPVSLNRYEGILNEALSQITELNSAAQI